MSLFLQAFFDPMAGGPGRRSADPVAPIRRRQDKKTARKSRAV
jgi:hypothetical protein|tara:strand:+ start:866 stop:994 length:129 start_codon:yes stop_codon:yes gene_type:complete